MRSLIKKVDFFSHKVTLTFNKNGETGYKTFLGGLITISSIMVSIICSFYFIFRLLMRKDLTVILSNQINPFVNITYSHKLPFLLRLTDTNSLPFDDDDRLYYITGSVWHGGSNYSEVSSQHNVSFKIGKCDINKHFTEEYKNYFKNISDLNTYYCIEPRNSSQTIYGLYGNRYPFSYYSFTVRHCKNTTENNNSCYSYEQMKEKMMPPYLEVIFIDHTINSMKKENVKEIFIRKERYEISTVLYKRIWLYLDNVKYIIDNGYIFSHQIIEYFHTYETIRNDFNIFEGAGVFVTLTVLNSIKSSIYNKQYTKAQDYLAIIGGLVKVITLFGTLLNYYNSQNSYYLKIIKDFIIINKLPEKYISQKNIINNLNILPFILPKSKNNFESSLDILTRNKNNYNILSINNNNNNKKNNNNNNSPKNFPNMRGSFGLINKSITTKILPSIFLNKKNNKTLKIYKEFINDRLNVLNILKKLEIIDIYNSKYKKTISNITELNESYNNINKNSNFING